MRKGVIVNAKNAVAIAFACVVSLLCLAWCGPAYAYTSGSIELTCGIDQGGKHVVLAQDGYALTKVASVKVDESPGTIVYATERAFLGIDRDWSSLDAAGMRTASHEVFSHAEKHRIGPQRTEYATREGRVVFSSLEPGLYLIDRFDVASGNDVFSCDPMLVSVPSRIDGDLVYSVEVTPKFEHGEPSPGPGSDDEGAAGDSFGHIVDKVTGALDLVKTSDGSIAVICVALLCAFGAIALLSGRRRGGAEVEGQSVDGKNTESS